MIPTPVPDPTAIIRFCIGNATVTAVSAASDSLDTKMLSTILYSACTSMEAIIGMDMLMISFFTGMTPILFSFLVSLFITSSFALSPVSYVVHLPEFIPSVSLSVYLFTRIVCNTI